MAVQWLRLCPSTAGSLGSIPGQGTKIPHPAGCGGKKKNFNGTFYVKTCHVWYIVRAQNVAVIIITIIEHRLIPGVAPRASTAHFSSSGEWWEEGGSAKSICDNFYLYFFSPQILEIN